VSEISEQRRLESYLRSTLNALIPSQIRGLRLNQGMTQAQLAEATEMKQARVSACERIGEVNYNLDTIVRFAAAFGAGLIVKMVPLSEMQEWEDNFSQDAMDVTERDNTETLVFYESLPVDTLFRPVANSTPITISVPLVSDRCMNTDTYMPLIAETFYERVAS
jgi:transcriptional regulator with XRE-family HTH domain